MTCTAAEAARGGDEPGRANGRASSASWRSKTSGAGEEREILKRSDFAGAEVWMGATRAALRRRGRAEAEERGPRARDWPLYVCNAEARQDGEGGGRRRWEGAPAAVAGDGAARKRQVARGAAAGRNHRQGPQELRAHAQPAARHQVTNSPHPVSSRPFLADIFFFGS
jgi:hypothetical protein